VRLAVAGLAPAPGMSGGSVSGAWDTDAYNHTPKPGTLDDQ